jgi:hypothetical protein
VQAGLAEGARLLSRSSVRTSICEASWVDFWPRLEPGSSGAVQLLEAMGRAAVLWTDGTMAVPGGRVPRELSTKSALNCLKASPARCPQAGRCHSDAPSYLDRSPGRASTARREMRPTRIAPILQPDVHGSCDDAHCDETPKTDEPEKNVVIGREVGHRCDVCVVGCLRCPNCSRCARPGRNLAQWHRGGRGGGSEG